MIRNITFSDSFSVEHFSHLVLIFRHFSFRPTKALLEQSILLDYTTARCETVTIDYYCLCTKFQLEIQNSVFLVFQKGTTAFSYKLSCKWSILTRPPLWMVSYSSVCNKNEQKKRNDGSQGLTLLTKKEYLVFILICS